MNQWYEHLVILAVLRTLRRMPSWMNPNKGWKNGWNLKLKTSITNENLSQKDEKMDEIQNSRHGLIDETPIGWKRMETETVQSASDTYIYTPNIIAWDCFGKHHSFFFLCIWNPKKTYTPFSMTLLNVLIYRRALKTCFWRPASSWFQEIFEGDQGWSRSMEFDLRIAAFCNAIKCASIVREQEMIL